MRAVHLANFHNDWDLINPEGEVVVEVAGSQRRRAIAMAWKIEEFKKS